MIRNTSRPIYPEEARRRRIEGTVEIEFVIATDGRVESARVVKSIPELDAAALEAIYKWDFYPARLGGQAVRTVAKAPVTFRLDAPN